MMPSDNDSSYGSLDALIPTVNKLQDSVFSKLGYDAIDLPQIVVVGSQSSGKSSILEAIVGREFLPRGNEIVTRRPLILQLVNTSKDSGQSNADSTIDDPEDDSTESLASADNLDTVESSSETFHSPVDSIPTHTPGSPKKKSKKAKKKKLTTHTFQSSKNTQLEYTEFLHLPGERFTDFNLVCQEILKETSRLAGSNKGVSRMPINLKIYSPNVLDLSLVDLPGIAKIPVGDQPPDIEKQIRSMILDYIAKPNCIILAVTPANSDLVNSDGLKLARQVDPQAERTIGVLTKIDLMDKGTSVRDILSGRVYPLKLGFVATVNRSQLDIEHRKPLREALKDEEEFFASSPIYRPFSCGTQHLAKLLNKVLLNHIRDRLPEIKSRLSYLINETHAELAQYGTSEFEGEENQGAQILQLITRFATSFTKSIDGTSSSISTKELFGGARIYYIFESVYGNSLKSIEPSKNLTLRDVRTAIRNSAGPRSSLFVPELAFELLIKPQIQFLRSPSQRCVDLVYEELIKMCHSCDDPEILRYPNLHNKLIEVVSDLLRERLKPTIDYVISLIDIQCAYINTNHPDFDGGSSAISSFMKRHKALGETTDDNNLQEKLVSLQVNDKSTSAAGILAGPSQSSSSRKISGQYLFNASNSTPALDQSSIYRTNSRTANNSENLTNSTISAISNYPENLTSSVYKANTSITATQKPSNKDSFLTYFFGTRELPAKNRNSSPSMGQGHTRNLSDDAAFAYQTMSDENDSIDILNDDIATEGDREEVEAELILYLITSYFNIVRRSIQDLVPKAIMHLLVNFSKQNAQNRLVSTLYRREMFNALLEENHNIVIERARCQETLDLYMNALHIVSEVL